MYEDGAKRTVCALCEGRKGRMKVRERETRGKGKETNKGNKANAAI